MRPLRTFIVFILLLLAVSVVSAASVSLTSSPSPLFDGGNYQYALLFVPERTGGMEQGAGIVAEFGVGDPTAGAMSWTTWTPAEYYAAVNGQDEFRATLPELPSGTWAYAFRFSIDNGPWLLSPVETIDISHDKDGDAIVDLEDNCPLAENPAQSDADFDGVGDACDACTATELGLETRCADGVDNDCNGLADCDDPDCVPAVACFSYDIDEDGFVNGDDFCPFLLEREQLDTDKDAYGDACDEDDDGDGVADATDNCLLVANLVQENFDQDGMGDACDYDDDNDSVVDVTDNCPYIANSGQEDGDGDGLGDACETMITAAVTAVAPAPRPFLWEYLFA